MEEGTIGRRYARALAETLDEGKHTDKFKQVEQELAALRTLLADKKGDFRQTMHDPAFGLQERQAVMANLVSTNNYFPVTAKFLELLVKQDRMRYLGPIADAFAHEVDIRTKQVRAHIVSAKPLDASMQSNIVAALEKRTGKTVIADVEVDESVIGGIKASIGGLVFDGTIRAQLDRLHADLTA